MEDRQDNKHCWLGATDSVPPALISAAHGRNDMVSYENRILLLAIAAAILLGIVVLPTLGAPEWLQWATLFVVGVLLPGYLTGRYRSAGKGGNDT